MSCKKIKVGHLACAVAMGLIGVSSAQAQTDGTMMMNSTTMSGTMSGDSSMMSQPTLVTGTVLRYYVDRSGYVTAMDVQTAEGVQFVRFSPGMGSRLYTTYPVGGTASVYVAGSPTTRWDVVSVGATAPAPGTMMQAYTLTDADLLDAEPYIMAGARQMTVTGTLTDLIVNKQGEVVGMVLDGARMKAMKGMKKMKKAQAETASAATMTDGTTVTSSTTTSGNTTTTVTDTTTVMTTGDTTMNAGNMSMNMMSMGSGGLLVRVPREFRHIAPGHAGTDRVTPLFKGATVEVTGYPELTRFGALDIYRQRIAANALVVNGRAVGALGVPMMSPKMTRSLFNNVNIGGAGRSAEEMRAAGMGYTVYGTSNTMGGDPAMTTDASGSTMTGTGTAGM